VKILIAAILSLSHMASTNVLAGQLAGTPPMGWNSWDAYGFTLDETTFKENATVLAGLRRYGWEYAVVDEGWYMANPFGADRAARQFQLDAQGRLIPALNRFPSAAHAAGLRPLADWTHQQGLKIGIHIVRGIPKAALESNGHIEGTSFHISDAADPSDTCPWDDGNFGVRDNAAGQAYYDSLLKQYAQWRIDFLKVDCISNAPYRESEIRQIASAIRRAGRPIVLSLSPGPTSISHATEVSRMAQMWRISNDVWDGWGFEGDFPIGVGTAFDKLALWNANALPGHWPDADMLPIGHLGPNPGWGEDRNSKLTADEAQSMFVLWAIARSPLILGGNLTRLDESTRTLISNARLIDLNQGPWRSHPVTNLPAEFSNLRVWVATNSSVQDDSVIAIFNIGSQAATAEPDWTSIGIGLSGKAIIDLVTAEPANGNSLISVPLRPHASVVYRVRTNVPEKAL
jgi:alpha-galactosidase